MGKEDTITADMDEAIDNVLAEMKSEETPSPETADKGGETVVETPEPKGEEEPKSTEEQPNKPKNGEEEPKNELSAEDTAKFNAIVERGVRAGMDIQDILAFPNTDIAERMIALAEKAAGISPKNKAEGDGDENPTETLDSIIEKLTNDGEYDADLVKAIKGLYEENKSLKTSRATEAQKSVFDTQFNGLDEGVRSHIDAASKSKLESKFKFLKSAYANQKVAVKDDEVFKEAAKLAIGDILEKVAAEGKAAKAAQRKTLTIARPGGEQGLKTAKAKSIDEIVAEVAAEI